MGTAWTTTSSTAATQTDVVVVILIACGVIACALAIYAATRKRYKTQWIVYGFIVFIVSTITIALVSEAIQSVVFALGVQQ